MKRQTLGLIAAWALSASAMASADVHALRHYDCHFSEGGGAADLVGSVAQGRFKLEDVVDSINRQQHEYPNEMDADLAAPTREDDGRVSLRFVLRGTEAGHTYAIYLAAMPAPGKMDATLHYDSNVGGNAWSSDSQGSCDLK
jgi:hypothetical protein